MKTLPVRLVLSLSLSLLVAARASATEVIFSTGWSNYSYSESQLCGRPSLEKESADDFDLVATVERVYVNGYNSCIAVCFPPPVTGAWVRFYEWTATGPGALQAEHFVPPGPGLAYDPTNIETVDVTLPEPFFATGRHYVSVQLEFADCFFWAYWVANKDNPIGGAAYQRTDGGAWTQVTAFSMASSDLSYSLFGTVGPPPVPQGCGQWAVEPSPNAPGSNQNWLNDVAVVAEDDIWAVGRSYVQFTASDWNMNTLAMHYDGNGWTIFPTPSPNPVPELTYCELNAVAALASDDVWAAGTRWGVGGGGYVGLHTLVLHWDGSSWEEVEAPMPGSIGLQGVSGEGIYEILALASDDIWFLGEWIRMDSQSFTYRHALAMHWDGSGFTVHEDMPIVGSGGATIYAADAYAPDDIWAVGASGDGDPAPASLSFIYHWDGSSWEHVPGPTIPGVWYSLGDVEALAPDDVWVSGSAWALPNQTIQFMLHWDGSGWSYQEVQFAGGSILGAPPEMYVFGFGGVNVFDGSSFSDAHLMEGLGGLAGFGFSEAAQLGPCEFLAAGSQVIAGDSQTLIARLVPHGWVSLGGGTLGVQGQPTLTAVSSLAANAPSAIELRQAAPASLMLVWLSFQSQPFDALGGTVYAWPFNAQILRVSDGLGRDDVDFSWPPGTPSGVTIYLQYLVQDFSTLHDITLSNAVRATTP